MGGTPFRINDRSVSSTEFQFFLDKLTEAGIDTKKAAADQNITGTEIKKFLDANGDSRLTSRDFRGWKPTVFQSVESVLDKHGFKLQREVENYDALTVSVHGAAKLKDGVCCFGREDRPALARVPDPEPVAGTGSGKTRTSSVGRDSSPLFQDYYSQMDQTYGPGTGARLKMAELLRRKAEASRKPKGRGLLEYDRTEVFYKISYGNLGLKVDPLKGTLTATVGGKSTTYPISGAGSVTVNTETGAITPGIGGSIGAMKLEFKKDGVHISTGGIGVVLGYSGQLKGGEMEPTLSLGPLMVKAKENEAIIGLTASTQAGKLKVEFNATAHFKTKPEAWQGLIIDGVDAGFVKVNDRGLVRPLLDALDGAQP